MPCLDQSECGIIFLQTVVSEEVGIALDNFTREKMHPGEVRLYGWLDASLREVVDLLKGSVGALREGNVELLIWSLY